jgi:hypothetical protein
MTDTTAQVALDRHETIGRRSYRITASSHPDGLIALRVAAHDQDGALAGEISGGISPDDLAPVTALLTSTLSGLAAMRRPRAAPPNQGSRWTPEDDARLLSRYREGATEKTLMDEFGRNRGGIHSRLERLGAIPYVITPPPPGTD